MNMIKKTKDELNQKNCKRLNLGRCAGFRYDIEQQQDAELINYPLRRRNPRGCPFWKRHLFNSLTADEYIIF